MVWDVGDIAETNSNDGMSHDLRRSVCLPRLGKHHGILEVSKIDCKHIYADCPGHTRKHQQKTTTPAEASMLGSRASIP